MNRYAHPFILSPLRAKKSPAFPVDFPRQCTYSERIKIIPFVSIAQGGSGGFVNVFQELQKNFLHSGACANVFLVNE